MSDHRTYRFPQMRIAVFARIPETGRVKTRLARGIGAVPATRAYRRMAEKTVARLSEARLAPVTVYATPHARAACFLRWRREYGVALRRQPDGPLGWRMHHVLGQALRKTEAAVVIGTDAPALDSEHIAAALESLQNGCEAVFVPCEDGGYALAGLNRRCLRLFSGIAWGSSRVMQTTRTRLVSTGVRARLLPPTRDVDTARDLRHARRCGLLG